MPIEIKELHIKINVTEKGDENAAPKGKRDMEQSTTADTIEAVMSLLNQKKER